MPTYLFECDGCGAKATEYTVRMEPPTEVKCECGASMRRSWDGVASTQQEYQREIYSDAMGVSPDQVKEHRQKYPSVPITDDGRVVIRSHYEQKRIMKILGYHNKDSYL